MNVPDSILKALEDLVQPVNSLQVTEHVIKNRYYDFSGKTPEATISAQLGDFLRKGDSRVKRYRGKGGLFFYYLTKNEDKVGANLLVETTEISSIQYSKLEKARTYTERDLHILLSTYLNSTGISAKTIFHEQSNAKDNNQIWTHPDMVGVNFLNLQSQSTQKLLKAVDSAEIFKLNSYEIKKEINSDNELKQAFFQAVSNSSWANYGYLVALGFSTSLTEEMSRLNQSFGIGLIQLSGNPFLSRVLFPAQYRAIDFKTMDKLCRMNKEFDNFIEKIEGCLIAQDRFQDASRRLLNETCDKFFTTDSDAEQFCLDKGIFYDSVERKDVSQKNS